MGGQTLEEMARYESDYKNDESTGTSDVWRYGALRVTGRVCRYFLRPAGAAIRDTLPMFRVLATCDP